MKRLHQYYLKHHSGFFQEVSSHVSTNDSIPLIKTNFNVFTKATAVVIPGSFGISNRLKKGNVVKVKQLVEIITSI